ncbi:unnamed protein product [Lathyrus oleraceus]
MAEKPGMTLREYSRPLEIQSCIVLPPVDEDVSFEIDPSLISLIMTSYQFGGLPSEDPNVHLQDFLLICSTTKCDGLCEDGLRLRLFPFSLKDKAMLWFRSLPARSITTWDQLVTKFRAKYFPLSRLMKTRIDIVEFAQFESESLYEAKERFQDLLRRCPDPDIADWFLPQIFFKGLTPANQSLLDVSLGGYLRKNKPTMAYDLLDEMTSTDFQEQRLEKLHVSATHTLYY